MKNFIKTGLFILTLFAVLASINAMQTQINVLTIGDSTMAAYNSATDLRCGWVQKLPQFFNENARIVNFAQSGRSTKSFIDEGLWNNVYSKIREGDYVIIQFGHNDAKDDVERHTDPWTTYSENLTKFVNETREKGGNPILCTPIRRRYFNADGTVRDSHGDYPAAARKVAEDLNVPLIDLTAKTKTLLEAYGPEDSKKLFNYVAIGESPLYPNGNTDDTHLNALGATKVAELAVEGLQELNDPLALYLLTAGIELKSSPTSIKDYALKQNYPNPFNPQTAIRFTIPEAGNVTLKIYNQIGQEIATLVNGYFAGGEYEATWQPQSAASGIYFYHLHAGQFSETRKMIFQK